MTPETLLAELRHLVATNRDREAIELADRHFRPLASAMTPEQIVEVGDLMEWADMSLDLDEADRKRTTTEPSSQVSRSA
jgi:hypothetical protein